MARSLSIIILLFALSLPCFFAQSLHAQPKSAYQPLSYPDYGDSYLPDTVDVDTSEKEADLFPDPTSVMYKSMMIPGWGQITNKQIWKVPIIYGMLGGVTWYSIQLTHSYHDYRAAYYNLNPNTPDDMRFGPTPDYIPESTNLEALRENRNALRNRRDLMYIIVGLAYGLNVIDAYVFAHMRSFDVSEDLSMKTTIKPSVIYQGNPGVTLSIELFNKSKTK